MRLRTSASAGLHAESRALAIRASYSRKQPVPASNHQLPSGLFDRLGPVSLMSRKVLGSTRDSHGKSRLPMPIFALAPLRNTLQTAQTP